MYATGEEKKTSRKGGGKGRKEDITFSYQAEKKKGIGAQDDTYQGGRRKSRLLTSVPLTAEKEKGNPAELSSRPCQESEKKKGKE